MFRSATFATTTVLTLALATVAPSVAQAQTAASNQEAALKRFDPDNTVLILVDYTSGLYPIVDTMDVEEMLNNAVGMAKVARVFGIPIMVMGDEGGYYGEMHPAIRSFAGEGQPFKRTTTSGWASGGLKAAVEKTGRKQVLIGGISTDNCTLFTSLDMLSDGYDVRVVTDIEGAESEMAENSALWRLRDAGAVTTGWVSAAFDMAGDTSTPEFKQLREVFQTHLNGPYTSLKGTTADDATTGLGDE